MGKKGKKKGPSNKTKGGLISIIMILLLIGGILGWVRVNDINSFASAHQYFKAWSDKADEKIHECKFGDLEWECRKGESPSSPGSPPAGATHVFNGNSSDDSSVNIEEITSLDGKKALARLNTIPEKPERTISYDRGEWRHWSGKPCNTRIDILVRDGTDVKVENKGSYCKVVSGKWTSLFDNKKFTESRKLDIDHVVPLNWAARNGAQEWSDDKKEQFANDPTHLLAVSASSNRSKGSKGPGDYMPREEFHCTYSKIWITTLDKYELSAPKSDKIAMEKGLEKC